MTLTEQEAGNLGKLLFSTWISTIDLKSDWPRITKDHRFCGTDHGSLLLKVEQLLEMAQQGCGNGISAR